MFDILFGWKKASKCKKMIKMVQCRLKLVKNKRCCIVNLLRQDVAELLKQGHTQTAFQRVEQIIMDESMVQLYDLLDQFCQFLILNFPYIRKHRDCPNDINEACSTLIFSSARFGELPELMSLRKLFGDRYGQRFVITAIELRPGNLVSPQLKENLYIKKVSDDLKYKLLAEITSSYIQEGPLLLEYKPELQSHENYESTLYNGISESPRKIMYLDDIEEFVSPMSKDLNFQDQRLFVFKSIGMNPLSEKVDCEGKIEYRLGFCKRDNNLEGENGIFQQSSLRAITMPAERTKESLGDNNIVPYEQPRIEYSSCRHIHPKLPDYDELEAKFKELKRANLRSD